MARPVVLIVGCGIAGPVLASFLKRKGYHPIVFERVKKLGDAGASLMLMPNGMKVLGLTGLAEKVYEQTLPLEAYEDCAADGKVLGRSSLPSQWTERYGRSAVGVKRTALNLLLKEMLIELEVEVREGWELVKIEESEHGVKAHFTGGRCVEGSFLVGCDGIKSICRQSLLELNGISEALPSFTGLSQTAGISPTPASLRNVPSLRNWYGQAIHMIAYPISDTHTSWALTLPESEGSKETWRLYDNAEMTKVKGELAPLLSGFDPAVVELLRSANRLVKFGLFDRPELEAGKWSTNRCVLVGDAAHPTSPHLGQGANQALEDCFHLSHQLPFLHQDLACENTELRQLDSELPQIFRNYAQTRQPRTSALVRGARTQGEVRVVRGDPEACKERDQGIAASWTDTAAIMAKYDGVCREPFDGIAPQG